MTRILIIDDSELVRERVKEALARSGLCDELLLADNGLMGVKASSGAVMGRIGPWAERL